MRTRSLTTSPRSTPPNAGAGLELRALPASEQGDDGSDEEHDGGAEPITIFQVVARRRGG